MKREAQLEAWMRGESIHNDALDECCPDYSCCNSEITTGQEMKDQFFDAYQRKDWEALGIMNTAFIAALMVKKNYTNEVGNPCEE